MARTEEYEGTTYLVFDAFNERTEATDEVCRQMLLWGHCDTRWVARMTETVILIPKREVEVFSG